MADFDLILRGGTVGGSPSPTMRWTADGVSYSGELLIPANGVVALKDLYLDTGVTVTFTGVLVKGDKFSFTCTAPTSSAAEGPAPKSRHSPVSHTCHRSSVAHHAKLSRHTVTGTASLAVMGGS